MIYQFIHHDFQLVRRRTASSKVRERYSDPHESNCLEDHLEQVIGRRRLCENFHARRVF